MKAKLIVSLLVVAVITLSFSFVSVKNVTEKKRVVTFTEAGRSGEPIGGLASTDKLD